MGRHSPDVRHETRTRAGRLLAGAARSRVAGRPGTRAVHAGCLPGTANWPPGRRARCRLPAAAPGSSPPSRRRQTGTSGGSLAGPGEMTTIRKMLITFGAAIAALALSGAASRWRVHLVVEHLELHGCQVGRHALGGQLQPGVAHPASIPGSCRPPAHQRWRPGRTSARSCGPGRWRGGSRPPAARRRAADGSWHGVPWCAWPSAVPCCTRPGTRPARPACPHRRQRRRRAAPSGSRGAWLSSSRRILPGCATGASDRRPGSRPGRRPGRRLTAQSDIRTV